MEVNKANVGTEAAAFVFTTPLMENLRYSTPHHVQHTPLYLYTIQIETTVLKWTVKLITLEKLKNANDTWKQTCLGTFIANRITTI